MTSSESPAVQSNCHQPLPGATGSAVRKRRKFPRMVFMQRAETCLLIIFPAALCAVHCMTALSSAQNSTEVTRRRGLELPSPCSSL